MMEDHGGGRRRRDRASAVSDDFYLDDVKTKGIFLSRNFLISIK